MRFRTTILLLAFYLLSCVPAIAGDSLQPDVPNTMSFIPSDTCSDEEVVGAAAQYGLLPGSTYPNELTKAGWRAIMEKRPEEALNTLIDAGELSPGHPIQQQGIALSYCALNCPDEALAILRPLLKTNPDDNLLKFHTALALEYRARTIRQDTGLYIRTLDSALALYSQIKGSSIEEGYVLYCRSRALYMMGEYDEAHNTLSYIRDEGFDVSGTKLYSLSERTIRAGLAASRATEFGYDPIRSYMLYVDVPTQTMLLYRNGCIEREFVISTGRTGSSYSARLGSQQTPLGIMRIRTKIGEGAPKGSIFKSKVRLKRMSDIITQLDQVPPKPHDRVLTRVITLEGMEKGINKGRDERGRTVDAWTRCIYIHGTNNEAQLGTPVSHGCIRMFNDDVIWLFDHISTDTYVVIEKPIPLPPRADTASISQTNN